MPVCVKRKNPQPMEQSGINPSPATTDFSKNGAFAPFFNEKSSAAP